MSRGKDLYDDGFAPLDPAPPSAPMGHNNPPEALPVGEELEALLLKTHAKLLKRAEELRSKSGLFKSVANKNELTKATEYVRQLQAAMKTLDQAQAAEKEPYRVAIGQVAGVLVEPFNALELIKRNLERLMTAFNQKVIREERAKRDKELAQKRAEELAKKRIADEAKRKAEEAQRKADEAVRIAAEKAAAKAAAKKSKGVGDKVPTGTTVAAQPVVAASVTAAVAKTIAKAEALKVEAKTAENDAADANADTVRAARAAQAPAAELTRHRSANAVQSAQEYVDFTISNFDDVDIEKLRSFIPQEAINQAVRAYVRIHEDRIKRALKIDQPVISGVSFFINGRTRVGG